MGATRAVLGVISTNVGGHVWLQNCCGPSNIVDGKLPTDKRTLTLSAEDAGKGTVWHERLSCLMLEQLGFELLWPSGEMKLIGSSRGTRTGFQD